MYKAIVEIGGYKIGDEVPTEKALRWIAQYSVPQVEEVEDKPAVKIEEVKKEESYTDGSSILEDYLARKGSIVKKNVTEDKLSNEQLKELLRLEKSDKNRFVIINAIEKRLAN